MNDTKFELTFVVRNPNDSFRFQSSDIIKSDDLIHLLSQFMMVLVRVQKDVFEQEKRSYEGADDVPF